MTHPYRRGLAVIFALACTAAFQPQGRAHHSHGNYVDTFTDIEGVVKEVHLVNPHSWIYIEVKGANGQVLKWSLEASSRIALERIGVTHEYIKAGDSIKVRCHPLRDGSRGCLLGFVKAGDGSIKDWDASNVPLPSDF
jgi:Family of unknown function (DUF6152)